MLASTQSPPLPNKPSVAVLAFTNMSPDPEQEFFGDGIAEDVITALGGDVNALPWYTWTTKPVVMLERPTVGKDDAIKPDVVRHRMWEARRELYKWLADGAALYVCGDATAMAKDVHATLLRIAADQAGQDAEAAAAWLRGLQQAGRYLRDVY